MRGRQPATPTSDANQRRQAEKEHKRCCVYIGECKKKEGERTGYRVREALGRPQALVSTFSILCSCSSMPVTCAASISKRTTST